MRKRNRILSLLLGMAMVFSLTACGGGKQTDEAGTAQENEAEDTQVQSDAGKVSDETKDTNQVTVISPSDNGSLNIYTNTIGKPGKIMVEPFVQTLWQYNKDMELEGVLCEDFTYDEDGMGITLKLRQGVKWHNGDDFTSADVVYTLGTMLAESPAAPNYNFIDYADVTAADDYTVHVGLSRQMGLFEHRCSDLYMYCKSFEEGTNTTGTDGGELLECGTGSYIVTEYEKDDHVSYKRNDDYWQDVAKLDGLTIRFIGEAATAFLEVQTGEAQISLNISASDQSDVLNGKYENLSISNGANMSHYAIGMNQYNPYFESPEVREAINHAINREEVFAVAFEGVGTVAYTPVCVDVFGFDEQYKDNYPFPYDPEKAKELLAQAGYADGFSCSFAIENNTIQKTMAELVQGYLSEVGITVTIDMYEAAALTEVLKGADWGLCQAMCNMNGDPSSALNYQCNVKNVGTSDKFNNDRDAIAQECTRLLEEAETISNPEEREKVYFEFQKLYFESPWEVPVCDQSIYAVYSSSLDGYWGAGVQPHFRNLSYK